MGTRAINDRAAAVGPINLGRDPNTYEEPRSGNLQPHPAGYYMPPSVAAALAQQSPRPVAMNAYPGQAPAQVKKQAATTKAEGTAGGGAVTVTINGLKQVLALKIDPEVVSKEDTQMLEEMILAAFADAHRKVDEDMKKQMGGLLGGLGLPGL